MRGGVIILAVLALSGVALAQPKNELNESAKAMIGAWEFSNAAHDKVCSVTFGGGAAKTGYKLTFAPECAALFPVATQVVGWRYPEDDLLYLLDADGKALVEFSEVEDGMFEAPTPGVGVLFLNKPGMDQPDTGEQQDGAGSPPAGEPPAPQQTPAPKNDGG
ncbi:MAG: AprI/Inh family metalloprotease inhibitor [Pseudolabrys sp.]|jgi:hypothetical protein